MYVLQANFGCGLLLAFVHVKIIRAAPEMARADIIYYSSQSCSSWKKEREVALDLVL